MLKRTENTGNQQLPKRRVRRTVLSLVLSVAMAVVMMPAIGMIGGPAFGAEKNVKNNNPAHQNAFAFPKGKALKALEEEAKSYPDDFDLRSVDTDGDNKGDTSYVTPVKVQNPFGTCWGFAAIAAAESSLLSSGLAAKEGYDVNTLDLSEKQLAYFANTYIDDPDDPQYGEGTHFRNVTKADEATSAYKYDTGGMSYMTTSLLASGIGPVQEHGDDPDDPLVYRGARGERSLWNVATKYLENGKPDPNSYQRKPVWYSSRDDWSIPGEYRFRQDYRLKDSFVLPDPAGYADDDSYRYQPEAIAAIKQQLYDHHRAVSVSFCAESYLPGQDTTGKKYMSEYWAHYTNTQESSNHTVTIVGWDDNYPKENFNSSTEKGGAPQPEGNGAFLIKNSWGSELNVFPNNGYRHWGLLQGQDGVPYDKNARAVSDRATGYFWISYYDRSLNDPEAFSFEEADESTFPYYEEQMDLMVPAYCVYFYDDGIRMANVFTAEATSDLREISAMTITPGSDLSYRIYLLGEAYRDPQDGILIARGTRHFDYGGYHRIALDTPKVLAKGQQFSVVLQERSEGGDYISYSASLNNQKDDMYSVGVINEGESFMYIGNQWADLSKKSTQQKLTYIFPYYDIEMDNFPIKAFLEPIADPADRSKAFSGYLSVSNWQQGDSGAFTADIGETRTLTAEFHGISRDMPDSWNPDVTWRSTDEGVVTVAPKAPDYGQAIITGVSPGKADLIVDAGAYGVRVVSVTIAKAGNTLKVKGKNATVRYAKVSKKSQKLPASRVIEIVDKGQGAMTYAKVKGNRKLTISKKGTVTVKKGLKKGVYKVEAKVTARGNETYDTVTKKVTFKIRVK